MASAGVIPVREYGSAAEMQRHAAELRARMFAPRPHPKPVKQLVQVDGAPAASKAWSQPQVEEKGFIAPETLAPQLSDQFQPHPVRRMTTVVAQITGISFTALRSDSKVAETVKARHILFYVCRTFTCHSFPEIARRIGGRDHTTAMHGVRRVQAVVDRLNIKTADGPVATAERLWSADWSRKV